MRLRVQFTLVMVTLAVAPTMVTGMMAIRTATRAAEVLPEESLAREATTLATAVGSWLDAQSATLSGWRRVWNIDSKDPRMQEGLLRAVHRAIRPVTVAALLDEAGRPVVEPVWLPAELTEAGRVPATAARVSAFLERAPTSPGPDGVQVGPPYLADGIALVPISVGPPGSGLVLSAEVSLTPLSSFFDGTETHATVLLDGARRPLLGAGGPLTRDATVLAATQPGMDLSFETDVAGIGRIRGAVSAVPGTDWVVLAVEPDVLAARAARTIQLQTLFMGLLVLVAVSIAAWALERTIARPIARLRDGAASIAGGDFDARIAFDGPDELVQLADAFNDMTERLDANREELDARQARIERFNVELQQRVTERTAELQAAQARLVQAGQLAAVAEVGAGLAHELNNPMTAILGQVQLMRVRGDGDAAMLEALEAQVHRCREVVQTMVRFASGEVDPRQAPVIDLTGIVGRTGDRLRVATRSRGVDIELRGAAPAMIRMDPAFAEQIVVRLLEVAALGVHEGGRVLVEVTRAADEVAMSVWTDPLGTTTDDQRASGMRLWVARRLIDLAGGVLDASDGRWNIRFPGA